MKDEWNFKKGPLLDVNVKEGWMINEWMNGSGNPGLEFGDNPWELTQHFLGI